MNINEIIDALLKEEISHFLGDSGGAYGYQYERNRERGYLKGLQPVEEYSDGNERTLEVIIPIYDFLTYNLIKDELTIGLEKQLFGDLEKAGIEPESIFEVADFLNSGLASFYIEPSFHQNEIKYINTFNNEEYLSQTLLYCTFSTGNEDYVILSVHNGCDVRSGYTEPQLFKLKDIEYFITGQFDRKTECNCGLNDYTIYGVDDPTDSTNNYIGKDEVFERTYIDQDGNVRCKECNSVIKGGFLEY